VEVEDEVLERGRTQAGVTGGQQLQPRAVLGPSLLTVPVYTPAISPEPPGLDVQQW
jgi:hypothetical protein